MRHGCHCRRDRHIAGDLQRFPDILVDSKGLICTPDEATASEGRQKEDTIVPLKLGTRLA